METEYYTKVTYANNIHYTDVYIQDIVHWTKMNSPDAIGKQIILRSNILQN